jgi:hypothetical protein
VVLHGRQILSYAISIHPVFSSLAGRTTEWS